MSASHRPGPARSDASSRQLRKALLCERAALHRQDLLGARQNLHRAVRPARWLARGLKLGIARRTLSLLPSVSRWLWRIRPSARRSTLVEPRSGLAPRRLVSMRTMTRLGLGALMLESSRRMVRAMRSGPGD